MVQIVCSAFYSCSWPPTALRGTVFLGAGLSTSSASKAQGWHCLGLEYPSGAIMEVRGRGGEQPHPGSLRVLELGLDGEGLPMPLSRDHSLLCLSLDPSSSFASRKDDTILGLEEVRLVPSIRNQKGAVWSETSVLFPAWEVEMQMRVTGPGHRGAQGMAVWYTQNRGQVGSVFGGLASWDGIGIFFDSSAEDTQDSPAIRVVASDGYVPSEQLGMTWLADLRGPAAPQWLGRFVGVS
ncbi:Hypothetical predicted protein [Marmota monax]|uniref:L-type lectin-like domain-containing protein n=1 Tax=Marmota monax TaxID=9995 RepID=A0A5E4B944_MARMO|nr:hypothetical protein GHT09_004232 [Marmota monax]VTJ65391.1 Hypothetical predicted protein [Marmota monax]